MLWSLTSEQTVFRISRLTDYGIVIMAHLADCEDDATHNARELASETRLPSPVVSKILKLLTRAGLLHSQRGSKGGYNLARAAAAISGVAVITLFSHQSPWNSLIPTSILTSPPI